MRHDKIILGITGPIACGKNEASRILQRSGAYVIDVDRVGHEVLKQRAVKNKLTRTFGNKILNKVGDISRISLGAIVFGDKKKLLKLNKISHPAILKEVLNSIKKSNKRQIVINAAVLKEIGLSKYCDQIWLVAASKANRIKRLLSKGLDKKEILKRINSQRTFAGYKKEADIIINNNGSKIDLAKRVKKLVSSYL